MPRLIRWLLDQFKAPTGSREWVKLGDPYIGR